MCYYVSRSEYKSVSESCFAVVFRQRKLTRVAFSDTFAQFCFFLAFFPWHKWCQCRNNFVDPSTIFYASSLCCETNQGKCTYFLVRNHDCGNIKVEYQKNDRHVFVYQNCILTYHMTQCCKTPILSKKVNSFENIYNWNVRCLFTLFSSLFTF